MVQFQVLFESRCLRIDVDDERLGNECEKREGEREREREREREERREWARECWSPKVTVRWAGIVLVCARHLAYSETA